MQGQAGMKEAWTVRVCQPQVCGRSDASWIPAAAIASLRWPALGRWGSHLVVRPNVKVVRRQLGASQRPVQSGATRACAVEVAGYPPPLLQQVLWVVLAPLWGPEAVWMQHVRRLGAKRPG